MAGGRLGILLVAAAAAAGCTAVGGDPGPAAIDIEAGAVVVPLHEGPDGLFALDLFLGEPRPRRFLLDTGCSVLAVDPALADALGFPGEAGPVFVMATATRRCEEVRRGALAAISLRPPGRPGAAIRGVEYWALPAIHGMDGIAGLALFPGCLVTLDLPRKELRIRYAGRGLADPDGIRCLACRAVGSVPFVPVTVGGLALEATLDTGFAGVLYLPPEVADRLRWREGARNRLVLSDANGPREVEERRLDGVLRIGDLLFPDPWVHVGEGGPLLGTSFLRDLRVTFDLHHGRVLFEKDGAPAAGSR